MIANEQRSDAEWTSTNKLNSNQTMLYWIPSIQSKLELHATQSTFFFKVEKIFHFRYTKCTTCIASAIAIALNIELNEKANITYTNHKTEKKSNNEHNNNNFSIEFVQPIFVDMMIVVYMMRLAIYCYYFIVICYASGSFIIFICILMCVCVARIIINLNN
jgi:hypothetical protein